MLSAVGQSSFPWDYKGQDIVRSLSLLSLMRSLLENCI